MKALDVSVLVGILHDSPGAKELLKSLHGEEIATTELDLFDLKRLAATASAAARPSREGAISRLRRRITVLPVSAEGVSEAGRFLRTGADLGLIALAWGVLSAAGCSEWITTREFAPTKVRLPFRVRVIKL